MGNFVSYRVWRHGQGREFKPVRVDTQIVQKNENVRRLSSIPKNWLGHVLRSESLLRTVLEGRMEGQELVLVTARTIIVCLMSCVCLSACLYVCQYVCL